MTTVWTDQEEQPPAAPVSRRPGARRPPGFAPQLVELGREALTFFLTHATPDRLQEAHDEIWLSGLDGGNVVMAEAPELPALHYVTLGHRVAVPLGAWAGSAVCDKGTRVSRRWLPIAPSVAPFAIVCRACVGHVATCPDCRPKLRVPARF